MLQWPGRHTVIRHLVPSLLLQTKQRVQSLLDEASALALNCDVWTSKNQRGYLGVTAHLIDSSWNQHHLLLGCPRFNGKHTSEAILMLVMELVSEFNIKEKIYFVGTDNGSNIVKAFDGWMPGLMAEFDSVETDGVSDEDDIEYEDGIPPSELIFDDELIMDLNTKIQRECPQAQCALSDRSILVW